MLRLVVSTTRAAIFKRRSRSVANSAVANSRALGTASRTASINQKSGGACHYLDLLLTFAALARRSGLRPFARKTTAFILPRAAPAEWHTSSARHPPMSENPLGSRAHAFALCQLRQLRQRLLRNAERRMPAFRASSPKSARLLAWQWL